MFTEADIQKLLGSFPPQLPYVGSGSALVRSKSGDHLLQSDTVQKAFDQLLREKSNTIPLETLSSELGVRNTTWLLEDSKEQLIYTPDGRGLLPSPAQKALVPRLEQQFSTDIISTSRLAQSVNISISGLKRLLRNSRDASTPSVAYLPLKGQEYVCTSDLLEHVKSAILSEIQAAGEKAVSTSFLGLEPKLELQLLRSLVEDVVTEHGLAQDGVINANQNDVCWVPHSQRLQQEVAARQSLQERVDQCLEDIKTRGYCELGDGNGKSSSIFETVKDRYRQAGGEELVTLSHGPSIILATLSATNRATSELQKRAEDIARTVWEGRALDQDPRWDTTAIVQLSQQQQPPSVLDIAILHAAENDPIHPIAQSYLSRLSTLQTTTTQALLASLHRSLLGPFQLYTNGLALAAHPATDPSLAPRLAEYILSHLQTDMMPTFLSQLKQQRQIPSKTSFSELEKFGTAVREARKVEDVDAAVKRLGRKLKVDLGGLDEGTLRGVKVDVLRGKVVAMGKMRRASDLLQNAVWVLMACLPSAGAGEQKGGNGLGDGLGKSREVEREAGQRVGQSLFLSSGKDTGRMIKLYKQLVGQVSDVETGEWETWATTLETLRSTIKEGKETDRDKAELRQIANSAFDSWSHS